MKNCFHKLVLTLIPLFMIVGYGQARDFFISPSGNDQNNGLTASTAWKTPQYAADQTTAGDRVLFLTGVYSVSDGQGLLVITRSGALNKPITFMAAPGQHPVFESTGAWNIVKIVGASYITLDHLVCRGNARKITLEQASREQNNLLNPLTCGNGITIDRDLNSNKYPSHIRVLRCDVRDFPGGGIGAIHADYVTIEDNVVARCGFWAPYACSGISIYQPVDVGSSSDYKNRIEGNVSFENRNYIPFYYSNPEHPEKREITDGNGIILDDFRHTQSKDSGGPYRGKTLVANNIVFGNGGSGIHAYSSDNVDIVFNWAESNNQTPGQASGQIFSNSGDHIRVLNNILVAPPDKPVNSDYRNGPEVVYDFNLYCSSSSKPPVFARAKAHNLVGQPNLHLISNGPGPRDFEIPRSKAVIGSGVLVPGVSRDFFGNIRQRSSADIGPFKVSPEGSKS